MKQEECVVTLSMLAEALLRTKDHLELQGFTGTLLEHDYFWCLQDEQYDLDATLQPGLGQLSEDLLDLRRVASGDEEPSAFDLVRIASLLTYVGRTYYWRNKTRKGDTAADD